MCTNCFSVCLLRQYILLVKTIFLLIMLKISLKNFRNVIHLTIFRNIQAFLYFQKFQYCWSCASFWTLNLFKFIVEFILEFSMTSIACVSCKENISIVITVCYLLTLLLMVWLNEKRLCHRFSIQIPCNISEAVHVRVFSSSGIYSAQDIYYTLCCGISIISCKH